MKNAVGNAYSNLARYGGSKFVFPHNWFKHDDRVVAEIRKRRGNKKPLCKLYRDGDEFVLVFKNREYGFLEAKRFTAAEAARVRARMTKPVTVETQGDSFTA